jgi:hypothetical protein
VLPIIEEIECAGITSHNAIAAKLNERNVRTARGGKWIHVQVGAVLRPRRDMGTTELVPPRRFIEPCLPSPAERPPSGPSCKKALARRSVVRCLIFALSGTDELFFIAWKTGE